MSSHTIGQVAGLQVQRIEKLSALALHPVDEHTGPAVLVPYGDALALAAVLPLIHHCDRELTEDERIALQMAYPDRSLDTYPCRMAMVGGMRVVRWSTFATVDVWLGLFKRLVVKLYPPETVALARVLEFAVESRARGEA